MMLSGLQRVQRDDPSLTHFLLCEPPTPVASEGPHFDTTYLTGDPLHLKRICDIIGRSSHLQDICFDAPLGLSDAAVSSATFRGLKHNTSIRSIGFSRCDMFQGVGLEVLKVFEENHEHLTKLAMWRCVIQHGGPSVLASTLANCTSLTEISLASCHIDDAIVEKLVGAVEGHRQLETLILRDNDIKSAGCKWIAMMLRHIDCNLVNIDLHKNMIDDSGAETVARALVNNKKVEAIILDENYISSEGWNAFSNIVCNQSSITKTYLSNHTLWMISSSGRTKSASSRLLNGDGVIPDKLFSLVEFNEGCDKIRVARQKILYCLFNGDFDIMSLVESKMEMKVLPHMLSWVGKPSDNSMGCAIVFNLLRQMPVLCDIGCAVKVKDSAETQQSDE